MSGACQQCVPLFCRQPVAQSDSQCHYNFDEPDSRCQIGAEQATLYRLVFKAAIRSKQEVYCTWGEMRGLEMHAIADKPQSC